MIRRVCPREAPHQSSVTRFQPKHERRFAHFVEHGRQHRVTHGGRERESDHQRGQDGEDITPGERREQPPLHARQRQHGKKHQSHHERGIDDGAADFDRRIAHDAEDVGGRERLGASRNRRKMFSASIMASSTTSPIAIASPPSVSVFRLTPQLIEKDHGDEERERDGGERDKRHAEIEEEQQQDDADQYGARSAASSRYCEWLR